MNRNTFLQTVTVIDTETTNLHAESAEIVEIAGARYDGHYWQVKDTLLGAKNGIPPEASAKNHISKHMINGLPTFAECQDKIKSILNWNSSDYFIAHNCAYDQSVLAKSWNDAASSTDATRALDQSKWICTHRLAKQLLSFDFEDMQYNLSYLRYKLDLPIPNDTVSHRAGSDTLVCAVLFEFLVDYALATDRIIDDDNIGGQIHALCWQPILYKNWPFGKNKGKLLSEIPNDYYVWALSNMDALDDSKDGYDHDLAESVRIELENRLSTK